MHIICIFFFIIVNGGQGFFYFIFGIYWTYNQICALDINACNDQDCMEIKSTLLSSAVRLKESALTIWPQRHISIPNNKKYNDKWSDFVTIGKKIMNEL